MRTDLKSAIEQARLTFMDLGDRAAKDGRHRECGSPHTASGANLSRARRASHHEPENGTPDLSRWHREGRADQITLGERRWLPASLAPNRGARGPRARKAPRSSVRQA